MTLNRRDILMLAARGGALTAFPPSIARALTLPALGRTGTIADVEHIVILMQENRSFDHYFGSLRGVCGFGDRHPIPLADDRLVWNQSNGLRDIGPFHLDSATTSALKLRATPHTFPDAQAAWDQGRLGHWPKFKTDLSMGHYRREDIPFQYALADAFTICDAHHCSITTGTDPNRVMFWSGSNHDPRHRAAGENCTDADAEVNNLRCGVSGAMPVPGYNYNGSALPWPTIPEILEAAGISWRIYQDPNDNWSGLMHGGLAFKGFREAQPGSAIYENGMRRHEVGDFAKDIARGALPQVSWILPSQSMSEHPAGSSPMQGAEFVGGVIDALTADPAVWGRTALFITFDENDGLFDHVPPPAPPSYNLDGTLAGKSTIAVAGLYLSDPDAKYRHAEDEAWTTLRPWGLGARVPLYVVSPWSRGGWVDSQVFDHSSIGQFIEQRFGVVIPAISPWHRAVCGDLTSAFDFSHANDEAFPPLPHVSNAAALAEAEARKPDPKAPLAGVPLFQEPGTRRSRALPYALDIRFTLDAATHAIVLEFRNEGPAGAVFHVYDRLHLDRIPRRFTVEGEHSLDDIWNLSADGGRYDLWVIAPQGFVRSFSGHVGQNGAVPALSLEYDPGGQAIGLRVGGGADTLVRANAYRKDGPWSLGGRGEMRHRWSLEQSRNWYDFTAICGSHEMRFAGRLETGKHGVSDPA